jgi:ATP-dependent exoDNAse (exonuclease V) beta subunit
MTILSERSIIDTNGDILRPDRLVKSDNEIHVIDFKTGKEDDKYFDQVKNYMNAISEIYSIPVLGFLLYTESGKIINVF